jgi:hypothetical protein
MKRVILINLLVLTIINLSFALPITADVDANWTFGANLPELNTGTRGDGSTGAYHHLPIGTSPYYYKVITAGEGTVVFWIYDPYLCTQNPAPAGAAMHGPAWGVITPSAQCATICIDRSTSTKGCLGYSPWSSVAASSPGWFKDGIRGADNLPWQAQWWKWTVNGTYDAITFTLHNVSYYEIDGGNHGGLSPVTGDCAQTYNSTSFGGEWAYLFGDGWQGVYFAGDTPSGGLEDISADVSATENNGIFCDITYDCNAVYRPYHQTTWGNIKAFYR